MENEVSGVRIRNIIARAILRNRQQVTERTTLVSKDEHNDFEGDSFFNPENAEHEDSSTSAAQTTDPNSDSEEVAISSAAAASSGETQNASQSHLCSQLSRTGIANHELPVNN